MNKFASVLLPVLACMQTASAAPGNVPLIGTWKSDHGLTMQYIRQTNVDRNIAPIFDQMSGHMTLTYSKNKVVADMPGFDIHRRAGNQDAVLHVAALHFEGPCTMTNAPGQTVYVSSSDRILAPVFITNYLAPPTTTTYHFVDHDTMWIQRGGTGADLFFKDARLREYFKRVR